MCIKLFAHEHLFYTRNQQQQHKCKQQQPMNGKFIFEIITQIFYDLLSAAQKHTGMADIVFAILVAFMFLY
jgi:hypothetical protein